MLGEDTGITIGLALALAGGLAGLWWRIEARFSEAAKDRVRIDRELSAHRLYAAETYATKTGVGAGMDRVVDELKGLRIDMKEGIAGLRVETRDGLDALGDRIVRMEDHVLSGKT